MVDELTINKRNLVAPVISFMADNAFVQSLKFLNGISLSVVKIFNNLRLEAFHCGAKCYITSLMRNYMTTVEPCFSSS